MAKTGQAETHSRDDIAIDDYRELLVEQRKRILDMYQHDLKLGKQRADEGPEDLVDQANNAYNREFMFQLSGNERQLLIQIEEAMERLEKGKYGICIECETEIAEPRLQAVPWARFCIDCQEKEEKGLLD